MTCEVVELPFGYRWLEVGEQVCKSDIFWLTNSAGRINWLPLNGSVGGSMKQKLIQKRRLQQYEIARKILCDMPFWGLFQ